MNLSGDVTVLSIMGSEYSIKAPAGEEQALVHAAALLQTSLADIKRQHPALIGDRLLVLAALNLCSQHLRMEQQHKDELARYREKVEATVDVISRTLAQDEA